MNSDIVIVIIIQLVGWFFTSAIMMRMKNEGKIFKKKTETHAKSDLFLISFLWYYSIPFYFLRKLWRKLATPKTLSDEEGL